MSRREIQSLAAGYRAEFDEVDKATWDRLLLGFDDANINQTWAYAAVTAGEHNISHLVLKQNGEVVAIAEIRIKRIPVFGLGIAYVGWGPLWRTAGTEANVETFRQTIRALRNEFVCKRGLNLRIFPLEFVDDQYTMLPILADEEFLPIAKESGDRTIVMNLTPSLDDLRKGMGRNWKRSLKQAEDSALEVIEGTNEELIDDFLSIYEQMVSRKAFVGSSALAHLKQLQSQLPEGLKLRIMICRSDEDLCAGLIWSAVGAMGIELFAATSNAGTLSRGSHLLRWRLVEKLKGQGRSIYNLNGINPEKNPGSYRFKSELAGKHGLDICYLGKFDANTGIFGSTIIRVGEALRTGKRAIGQRMNDLMSAKRRDGR